jgi:hypothetical protein
MVRYVSSKCSFFNFLTGVGFTDHGVVSGPRRADGAEVFAGMEAVPWLG